MATVIPLFKDALYDQIIPLDDTTFRLLVRWNSRSESWYMDIREPNGVPILLGIKLLPFVSCTELYRKELLPPGGFVLNETLGSGAPPGRDNITVSYNLVYLTPGELDAFIFA